MRLPRLVVALTLALLACACSPFETRPGASSSTALTCEPDGPALGAQFHGTWDDIDDAERARSLDALVASGATWVRIDVGWSTLQPSGPDRFDTTWGVPLVDRVLDEAHQRGLKVLVTFWLTPDWANDGAGRRVLPRDVQDYARAIRWAAQRWETQVDAWEVWNEPNAKEFLDPPDPAAYARLLTAAYPAVKAGDPKALVVFGGTMYVDTEWIGRALDAGATRSFDVMAVHPYQGEADLPPEAADDGTGRRLEHLEALSPLLSSHGRPDVPVWVTEFGWSAHANSVVTPDWERGVPERTQAAYLERAYALVARRYPEVQVLFWYSLRDTARGRLQADNRGLLRRDFSPRPVYATFRALATTCAGP